MPSTAHLHGTRVSSHSPHRTTKNATSGTSTSYFPQAESLILPDCPVGEEATALLNEFLPQHRSTPVGSESNERTSDDEGEVDKKSKLPWWKRPSPWWLLGVMPFTSIAASATIAPRIEIYTMLACSIHKPDIFGQNFFGLETNDIQPFSSLPTSTHVVPFYILNTSPFIDSSSKNGPTSPPKKGYLCASDPVVQAAVAKLTAVIAACTGILSCITTGWWGAFSDRYGRARVMGISIFGLLLTDFIFIVVALFSKPIPGGYWWLVVGPTVEGLLGGMTTGIAAFHSYMADTTSESDRSQIFSLSLGLMFTGVALGPLLGSLLIRFTGKTLSVFFAASIIHLLYTFLVWFILPESVSKAKMENAKIKYATELLETANEREQNPAVGFLVKLRRTFAFLSPLTIFMPEEERGSLNPLKKPKMDWNLTLMALGYAFNVSLMGSLSYKFQYAASAFGWDSQTIGYWISMIGATRTIFLTTILPVSIKLFKPEPIILKSHIPTPPRESTPLLDDDAESHPSSSTSTQVPNTMKKEIHSLLFDLNLARASLVVDIIVFAVMGLAPTATAFTTVGIMGSFGAGFKPAVQSVTLALYAGRGGTETGRLFGALSVVQALCSQILGPSLYGLIYMKTVATYPRAIFFVSLAAVFISLVLLSLVRLPNANEYHKQSLLDLEDPISSVTTSGVDHNQDAAFLDSGDVRPELGESGKDTGLKKRVGLPTYGAT